MKENVTNLLASISDGLSFMVAAEWTRFYCLRLCRQDTRNETIQNQTDVDEFLYLETNFFMAKLSERIQYLPTKCDEIQRFVP